MADTKYDTNSSATNKTISQPTSSPSINIKDLFGDKTFDLFKGAVGNTSLASLPISMTIDGKKRQLYYNYNSKQLYYYGNEKDKKDATPLTDTQIISGKNDLLKQISSYISSSKGNTLEQALMKTAYNLVSNYRTDLKGAATNFATKAANAAGNVSNTGNPYNIYVNNYGGNNNLDNEYKEMLKALTARIDKLENPKVWKAEELAKQFNVEDMYNMDYWNKLYNDKTNKYYTDKIAEQTKYNEDANQSNADYATRLLTKYADSYRNFAPTTMGRGTLAASALQSMLGSTAINEQTATQLNSLINDYKNAWNAELANNANLARNAYNDMGTWLLNRGVNVNTAEVQNYINTLKAYDTAYTGIRNAQVNLASTAANTYANNAQAALARNQQNAATSNEEWLKNAYRMKYAGNESLAMQAYNNTNHDAATKYADTYKYNS